jgi:hypothetical protein
VYLLNTLSSIHNGFPPVDLTGHFN